MKILLLGIGNVLYADEGVGVHFVNYISENYRFSHPEHQIDTMDGGTLAQGLTPILARYDHLIVVDTVNAAGAKPGQVYYFNFDNAPPEIDWQGSAHEVEMLQTLIMMEMVGDRPDTWILGMVPTVLEPMHLGLTTQIQAGIPLMEQTLLNHLQGLGITCQRVANVDITTLIPDSFKAHANKHDSSCCGEA